MPKYRAHKVQIILSFHISFYLCPLRSIQRYLNCDDFYNTVSLRNWLYTNILSILNLVSPHTAASYCVANLFMLQECTVVCSIINQKGAKKYWNIYYIVFKFVCFINVSNFHEAPFLRFKMTQSGIWGAHHITTSYELFFLFSVFWPLFGAVFMKATVSWSRSTTAIAFTQQQIYKEIRHFKFFTSKILLYLLMELIIQRILFSFSYFEIPAGRLLYQPPAEFERIIIYLQYIIQCRKFLR